MTARLFVLLAHCLLVVACRPKPKMAPPDIPIVPVTFERNLLTARECEFRGTVESVWTASSLDANLIVAFIYDSVVRSDTRNGVTKRWSYRGVRGKAMRCPKHTIERELTAAAAEIEAAARGGQ